MTPETHSPDDIWDGLLAYIGEHTGLKHEIISEVLLCEQEFWEAHSQLRLSLAREYLEWG